MFGGILLTHRKYCVSVFVCFPTSCTGKIEWTNYVCVICFSPPTLLQFCFFFMSTSLQRSDNNAIYLLYVSWSQVNTDENLTGITNIEDYRMWSTQGIRKFESHTDHIVSCYDAVESSLMDRKKSLDDEKFITRLSFIPFFLSQLLLSTFFFFIFLLSFSIQPHKCFNTKKQHFPFFYTVVTLCCIHMIVSMQYKTNAFTLYGKLFGFMMFLLLS